MNDENRQRINRIKNRVDSFRKITKNSESYNELIDQGIDIDLLDKWIDNKRVYKNNEYYQLPDLDIKLIESLISLGGKISGGAALNAWLNINLQTKDMDMFFSHYPSWVTAVLLTQHEPRIEIFLYEEYPWEGFDLGPSMISFDKEGFVLSPECEKSLHDNVCHVSFNNIINSINTLERMYKYHQRYKFKLLKHDIEKLIPNWKTERTRFIDKLLDLSI